MAPIQKPLIQRERDDCLKYTTTNGLHRRRLHFTAGRHSNHKALSGDLSIEIRNTSFTSAVELKRQSMLLMLLFKTERKKNMLQLRDEDGWWYDILQVAPCHKVTLGLMTASFSLLPSLYKLEGFATMSTQTRRFHTPFYVHTHVYNPSIILC